jgi:hypothetical protein
LADTNFQSITPRKTIEIQNRTVFTVELEFTLTSLDPQEAARPATQKAAGKTRKIFSPLSENYAPTSYAP